jgi:hypothetical protein
VRVALAWTMREKKTCAVRPLKMLALRGCGGKERGVAK